MTRLAPILFALLGSGCALNAALEVEMQLPSTPHRYAAVWARPPDWAFVDSGSGAAEVWNQQVDEPFDLTENACEGEGGTCNVRFSVLTENVDMEALRIRVRFCDGGDDCRMGGPERPELWFEIEHPFYQGQVTRWNPAAPPFDRSIDAQPDALPSGPEAIPACEVRGCWTQDVPPDPTFGYCSSTTGRHYCDG